MQASEQINANQSGRFRGNLVCLEAKRRGSSRDKTRRSFSLQFASFRGVRGGAGGYRRRLAKMAGVFLSKLGTQGTVQFGPHECGPST